MGSGFRSQIAPEPLHQPYRADGAHLVAICLRVSSKNLEDVRDRNRCDLAGFNTQFYFQRSSFTGMSFFVLGNLGVFEVLHALSLAAGA